MVRGPVVAALLTLSLACTHRSFQFRPAPDAEAAVDAAALGLVRAAGAGEAPALAGRLDLAGRDALLLVLRHVAAEQVKLEPPSRGLLLGSALTLSGGDRPAATAGEVRGLAAGVLGLLEQRLARALGLGESAQGWLGRLVREPARESPGARERELLAQAVGLELGDCRPDAPRVAYRGAILRHVPALGGDPQARAWRERVESLHLVTLACGERHGLVLLTRARGERAPRLVGWQFFSPARWELVRPRLEKALFG